MISHGLMQAKNGCQIPASGILLYGWRKIFLTKDIAYHIITRLFKAETGNVQENAASASEGLIWVSNTIVATRRKVSFLKCRNVWSKATASHLKNGKLSSTKMNHLGLKAYGMGTNYPKPVNLGLFSSFSPLAATWWVNIFTEKGSN